MGDTTCNVQESFEKAIRKCYAPYEEQYEDKETTIPDFRKYSSEAAWVHFLQPLESKVWGKKTGHFK